MREEEHIAQLDTSVTIAPREFAFIEPLKCRGQTFLHLAREWYATGLPVDRDEVQQVVRLSHHAREGIRHQPTMSLVTRHLPHEEQRSVTKIHLLARFDRESGHFSSVYLRYEFSDTISDFLSTCLLLDQSSRHNRPQLQLG